MSKHTPASRIRERAIEWLPILAENARTGRISKLATATAELLEEDAKVKAVMLSALEAVEWGANDVDECGYADAECCPRCRGHEAVGHLDDCPLHAALLLARGGS